MIILLCGTVDALFADFEVAIYVITARFRPFYCHSFEIYWLETYNIQETSVC
jgi:hypothetical protein